jgi:hypothetical protein
MRILSLLIFFVSLIFISRQPDSPHGSDFKISCKTCHSPKGWQLDKAIYSFDHNTTKLPLVGQHSEINCRQCHKTLVFSSAKKTCIECHNDIHQATVGGDCARCHTPVSWLVNNINEIHQTSRFPLLGAHRTADCYQCHKSESLARFDVVGVNCIDCHRKNYMATTNPNHIQSGMSEDCSFCHQVNSFKWSGGGFNHDAFPLVQGHSAVKCTDCHTTGRYADAKPDCYSCHQQDFLAAKSPDHNASKFSTSCTNCHTLISGWKPSTFNHSSFPLTLGHSGPACIDCHKGGNYTSTPTDCNSCHHPDYLATTNPNHSTSGFSSVCQTCHTVNPGWKPTTFNHSKFPLTLGHSGPACLDCHKGGNYTTTPTDCYGCHQQNYLATTNPNHTASGFATACLTCHTTNPGWKPTTFNHSAFPLTLGHSGPTCIECHKGNYTSTSTDCYSCHQVDYNNTTNPNHKTLAFAVTCTQCHTTNPGWKPATYTQHDTQFPIYSGKHKGQWDACSDCHTNTANYAVFNCISCHSNAHSGKNYTSAQCFSCHPRGTSD